MNVRNIGRSTKKGLPAIAFAVVAILILVLLGGLFHHHESEVEVAACCYCHAGVQSPVFDLPIVWTPLAPVGFATPARPGRVSGVVRFSKLAPRAPPAAPMLRRRMEKVAS